jgi:RimJ/RimL family protein N-acetyltransferase
MTHRSEPAAPRGEPLDTPPMATLATSRLVLEPLSAAHAEEMFACLRDPAIYEFENAPPASVEALCERYRRLESRRSADGSELWLNWVVRERATQVAIGYVQATVLADRRALIAYEFNSAHWGRGLAREAVAAMVGELRGRWRAGPIGAVFKRTNFRSRRLLERLGLRTAAADGFPSRFAGDDESAMVL